MRTSYMGVLLLLAGVATMYMCFFREGIKQGLGKILDLDFLDILVGG